MFDRAPHVHLLDPATGASVTTLDLEKSSILGGIYSYLDHLDRLVVADGSGDLLRIAHTRDAEGRWQLRIVERTPFGAALAEGTRWSAWRPTGRAGCGSPPRWGSSARWTPPRAPSATGRSARASPTASPRRPAVPPSPPTMPCTC
ncbi:hypothetical protein ACFQ60_07870 [Streptomyces zhihengii]